MILVRAMFTDLDQELLWQAGGVSLGNLWSNYPQAERIKALGHSQYPVQTIAYWDNCISVPPSDLCSGVLESLLHPHAHAKCARVIVASKQMLLFDCDAFHICCAVALCFFCFGWPSC